MKFRFFIVAAAIVAFAACKTPYKATDTPTPTTDTTATATDTSATMNKTPVSTDTAGVARTDTTRMDTTSRQSPDTSVMDTTSRQLPDSTRGDTTQMKPDTRNTNPSVDSASIKSQAPAAVEAAFTKQYPGAVNVVWAPYDSLAAVPIDMRLTGWKGLDPEDHMAKFDYKDETYYAWYDSNGKWIGSAYTVKDITKLPAAVNTAVNNAIKSRYNGYEISKVNRELQTGKTAYEVELTKDDNKVRMLVTSAGKITEIFKYKTADKK